MFAGGFTLDAAEAVCGGDGVPSVFELVGQLVDKSLVTPQETEDGSTRYAMLETVRECLEESTDIKRLTALLSGLMKGEVRTLASVLNCKVAAKDRPVRLTGSLRAGSNP